MTGYTVHTGSTVKFSDGWDKIFAKGAKKKAARQRSAIKRTGAKKTPKRKKQGAR